MKIVSIVIPAYNEERTIATLLDRVFAVSLKDLGLEKEVIVVDDASIDNTLSELKRHPESRA